MNQRTPRWSKRPPARKTTRAGFTLIEIILVVVISIILAGIALPHFAQTYRGSQLRTASRMIVRMSRYARSMAILRNTTLIMAISPETSEVYLGELAEPSSDDEADGELDQSVLKRLGYVEGDGGEEGDPGIDREAQHHLPDQIEIVSFESDNSDDDNDSLYLIYYYPNGRSDAFTLEFKDRRGAMVRLENDPISGKIRSKFVQ